jgi:ankyrin repeat protein
MGDTPLYLAATKGQLDAMKSLVELGADLTGIEKKLLLCAAKDGDQEMVEWLVEEKVGVNERVLNLEWALYFAAQRGRVELMKWLVEQKNVSVNAVLDGQSVLRQALVQGEWEAVRWIIDRGADVTATKDDGSTILHVAVGKGDLDIVKLLVKRGADVTAKQTDGSMAMHLAAKSGSWEMVQWLVKHGSDVRAETKDGSTIWQLAPIQGRQEMVEWLMEHRNDPTVVEGKGVEMIQWLMNLGVYDYRKYPSSVVPRNSETTRLMRTGPNDGQWMIFAGYCSHGYRSAQRKALTGSSDDDDLFKSSTGDEAAIKEAFKMINKSGSGFISPAELSHVMNSIGTVECADLS